jgi:DNA-binding beta-propeller fold protein YncE
VSLTGCTQKAFLGYLLDQPDELIELPKELREVSGSAWWDKDHIAMIQDEQGDLFVYDISRKKMIHDKDFGKKGDHEGVASDGEHLYIVRSDGRIYRTQGVSGKDVEHWDTPLGSKNDVEGICWDPIRQRLLLACKADPGAGLDPKSQRAVYAFDPASGEMDDAPVLVLALDSIAPAFKLRGQQSVGFKFSPSAIAIHPNTGHTWVLSAKDPMLVVVDTQGGVVDATHLDPVLFPQPEGLTFDADGLLYISSENKGHGRLLVYKPRSAQ